MPTAILIDGEFFLWRHQAVFGKAPAADVAKAMHRMCLEHLRQPVAGQRNKDRKKEFERRDLYRIFFYDCPPLTKRVHNPISKKHIDFSKTPTAEWRLAFHDELKKLRKVALRLGYLNERSGSWVLKPTKMKELLGRTITVDELTDNDVRYDVMQKGVDMRLGLDIASLAFKRQVDQIILVSGDSDFVPAAKLARREGIDFILDPLWASIRPDLLEHVDGMRTIWPKKSERDG
ncbi:MAG: hypothetical protein AMXMBFR82_53360 [Candidatus Hydrogenedentota bacterium]